MDAMAVESSRSNWNVTETKTLIAIWGHEDIQNGLDGMYRNAEVYVEVSKKMQEMGFKRNALQIRSKIKQLKNDYKKVKDSNAQSGNARKTNRYFEELDRILGHRPATRPSSVLSTSTTETDISDQENVNTDEEQDSDTNTDGGDGTEAKIVEPSDGQAKQKEPAAPVVELSDGQAKQKEPAAKNTEKRNGNFKLIKKKKISRAKEIQQTRTFIEEALQSQKNDFKAFIELEQARMKQEKEVEIERMRMDNQQQQTMMQMIMALRSQPIQQTSQQFLYSQQQAAGNVSTCQQSPASYSQQQAAGNVSASQQSPSSYLQQQAAGNVSTSQQSPSSYLQQQAVGNVSTSQQSPSSYSHMLASEDVPFIGQAYRNMYQDEYYDSQ
ncbi:uncharacterized protein LOC123534792 [Mercenaria mercenaria]|uniref:uncharacterized protein LOC123534792 n=1 Tax=Mercenaria mercenaria TaxID=6596 RepID=UPI00234FB477|nr:uncharacterized protein LOC123534792 [Mercenaria mercenaria]